MTEIRERVDNLDLDDLDQAAEQLAALREYARSDSNSAEPSHLQFSSIRDKIEMVEPWYRAATLRGLAWASGSVAVAAMLVAVFVLNPSEETPGSRLKGVDACCGTVRLRVEAVDEGATSGLSARTVGAGQSLSARFVVQQESWVSVYAVHLSKRTVRRLRASEFVEADTAHGATTFALSEVGKHVLLLLATPREQAPSDAEVLELLVNLGEGKSPTLRGEPCSADVMRLEALP